MTVEYRQFPASVTPQGPDPDTSRWMRAAFDGFLVNHPDPGEAQRIASSWQAEGRTLHAFYDPRETPNGFLGNDVPVATMATFTAGLHGGGDADIPCLLVADVTVRTTHRGQGLMRRLMDRVLAEASRQGVPLAALHAAHPALYERFGFAPATRSASIEVDCARFALKVQPPGLVHEADPGIVALFDGQLSASGRARHLGALQPHRVPTDAVSRRATAERGSRCLVHVDASGQVDGMMTFVFRGWTPDAQVIDVLSESWCTTDARAALWQTVTSTGIATTVRARDTALDEPLQWMLQDRSAMRVTAVTDGLSLRILDTAKALEGRGYCCPPASVALEVVDALDTVAGRWRITVNDGRATLRATCEPPEVQLHAVDMAAVFLGATRVNTLADAGRVTGSPSALATLTMVMSASSDPLSTLHF
ncbi:GNAT family N-acetyltransferase [Oryzihumus sp.]|uniref:GNAT family N-acetyltransferase n=1 Tax=Oryzihumus sp. TaxID=1968903 RepID=UPI002EDAC974